MSYHEVFYHIVFVVLYVVFIYGMSNHEQLEIILSQRGYNIDIKQWYLGSISINISTFIKDIAVSVYYYYSFAKLWEIFFV